MAAACLEWLQEGQIAGCVLPGLGQGKIQW